MPSSNTLEEGAEWVKKKACQYLYLLLNFKFKNSSLKFQDFHKSKTHLPWVIDLMSDQAIDDKYKKADHDILNLKSRDFKMKLFWCLCYFDLVLSNDNSQYFPDVKLTDSTKEPSKNKNAYQRSAFWEISKKSERKSEIDESHHIYPKSMLKELAQQGEDISHLEYSRPAGGHLSGIERGIHNSVLKWNETIIHPDTGEKVIVIPFTFQEDFPEKDIVRGYLMDMNSGWFSNSWPENWFDHMHKLKIWKPYQIYLVYTCSRFPWKLQSNRDSKAGLL